MSGMARRNEAPTALKAGLDVKGELDGFLACGRARIKHELEHEVIGQRRRGLGGLIANRSARRRLAASFASPSLQARAAVSGDRKTHALTFGERTTRGDRAVVPT